MTSTVCPKLNIGIWIESKQSTFVRREGIARVIGHVCGEILVQKKHKLVVACSDRTKFDFIDVLKDLGYEAKDIEFVTAKGRFFSERVLESFVQKTDQRILRNRKSFMLAAKSSLSIFKFLIHYARGQSNRKHPDLIDSIKALFLLFVSAFVLLFFLILNRVSKRILNIGRKSRDQKVFRRLHRYSKRIKDIDLWLIPRPDWDGSHLKGKKIYFVWDLIHLYMPIFFPVDSINKKLQILNNADGLFFMSQFWKENSLITKLGKKNTRCLMPPMHKGLKRIPEEMACNILKNYLHDRYCADRTINRYLVDFDFSKSNYIVISSQIRDYKNVLNAIISFEDILRRRKRSLKLLITAEFTGEVKNYLIKAGLVFDVLSISNVSTEVLHAFISISKGVLIPTHIEGGMPLPYLEATALGVPVACSKIPTVKEFVVNYNDSFFDPSLVSEIAKAIEYMLDHPDVCLEFQATILKENFDYNWSFYSNSILDLGSSF